MECRLEFLNHNAHEQGRNVGFHKHTCFELVYYVKGHGYTNIDGHECRYAENTFSIIQPFLLHDERHVTHTRVIFIGFQYGNGPVALKNGLFKDNPQHSVLELLEAMKQELLSRGKYYEEKAGLFLKELLIEYARLDEDRTGIKDEMAGVKRYIAENLSARIGIDALADISGYSYHHFRHLFKQKTGLSPLEYILQKRLEKARYLLANTTLTVAHIAQECGFPNSTQFCAAFKSDTKLTPTAYRGQNAKELHQTGAYSL